MGTWTLLLFFSLFAPTVARADSLFSLAADIRNIVWHLDPPSPLLRYSREETDRAIRKAQLDQELLIYSSTKNTGCTSLSPEQKEVAKKMQQNPHRIVITAHFSAPMKDSLNRGIARQDIYTRYLLAENARVGHTPRLRHIFTFQGLESTYLKLHPQPNWENKSIGEKSRTLEKFVQDYVGMDIPHGIMAIKYAQHAISQDSGKKWKAILSSVKEELTFKQKILLASSLGEGNDPQDIARAQSEILNDLGISLENISIIVDYSPSRATLSIRDKHNLVKLEYKHPNDIKDNYGINQINFEKTLNDSLSVFSGSSFTGTSSRGDAVTGVVFNITDTPIPSTQIQGELVNLDAQLATTAQSPSNNIDSIDINRKIGLEVEGTATDSFVTGDGKNLPLDGNVTAYTETKSDWQTGDDRTNLTTVFRSSYNLKISPRQEQLDEQDETSLATTLSQEVRNNLKIVTGATIATRALDDYATFTAGIAKGNSQFSISSETSLESPDERIKLKMKKPLGKSTPFLFRLEIEHDPMIENPNYQVGFGTQW